MPALQTHPELTLRSSERSDVSHSTNRLTPSPPPVRTQPPADTLLSSILLPSIISPSHGPACLASLPECLDSAIPAEATQTSTARRRLVPPRSHARVIRVDPRRSTLLEVCTTRYGEPLHGGTKVLGMEEAQRVGVGAQGAQLIIEGTGPLRAS